MPVTFEDSKTIQRIMSQLPSDISEEYVRKMFNQCNGNELETLCTILNVATNNQNKNEISATQKMWNNIREICDSYDSALNEALRKST